MVQPTDPNRFQEISVDADGIRLKFKESGIDKLAFGFCRALNRHRVTYAIVGGYVSILLGRPRTSEDVDIIAGPIPRGKFLALHADLDKSHDCLAAGRGAALYSTYLSAGTESTAVRYAAKGSFNPNVEFKFARTPMDRRALRLRIPISANRHRIFAAPLEMQIGYKLYMASPKDFEDARWIYRVAAGSLDENEIWRTAESLGVTRAKGRKILGAR